MLMKTKMATLSRTSLNLIASMFELQYVATYLALWYLFIQFCCLATWVVPWYVLVTSLVIGYRYFWCENLQIPRQEDKDCLVVIIGSGFAGICAAVRLKLQGVPFIVLEKAESLGGTWLNNQYPGNGCDTMVHMYVYSFFQSNKWTRMLEGGSSILAYLHQVSDHFQLLQHLKFNTKVEQCVFNETTSKWTVTTSTGESIQCNFIISAVGFAHIPNMPNIKGMDKFEGDIFHTSKWPKDYECKNKRVALVGTGCSGIQVMPYLARRCQQLCVLQRKAAYVLPKFDLIFPDVIKQLFKNLPFSMILLRWYIFVRLEMIYFLALIRNSHTNFLLQFIVKKIMSFQVEDPKLKDKLIPDYVLGCKRITISSDYISSFNQPNVQLIDTKIREITKDTILTEDGHSVAVDTIILATGFNALKSIAGDMKIVCPSDGKTLSEIWNDDPTAFLGTCRPGFPNFFTLLGPGTELGHNSVVWMAEQQMYLISKLISRVQKKKLKQVDVTQKAFDEFQVGFQRDLRKSVFDEPCQSWYQNEDGFSFLTWPSHCLKFWWKTRTYKNSFFQFK
ncbi:baeyer-Villiger monooxygenase-like [Clytia hemisphaerica]|uniref:Flavin-containing monooxygenase n=1 Tax=Clytia hemisphaerica TaxID=252671 RepID=A0A7M5V684_9CNID